MPHSLSSLSNGLDLTKSHASQYIKFALICLNKSFLPSWLAFFCFIASHIQTLALLFKNSYISLKDNTPASSPAVRLFIKLSVLGDWLEETDLTAMTVGIMIITLYMFQLIGMLIYLNMCLYYRKRVSVAVQRYWSIVHSVQPLVMFFWIHTFCLEIIKHSRDEDFDSPQQIMVTVLAYLNVVINWLISIVLPFIYVIFKTEYLMSSKENSLQILDMILKTLIPVAWMFCDGEDQLQIAILTMTLMSMIFKDWILISRLPYYKIKILEITAIMHAPKTMLAMIAFIVKLVDYNKGKSHGIFCVNLIWLLLVPVAIKMYYYFLWRLLGSILTEDIDNQKKNFYHLIQKPFILKHCLKKKKFLHGGVNNLELTDILYHGKIHKLAKEFDLDLANLDNSKKDKVSILNCKKAICLKITQKFPQSMLAQMNLAYIYSKFDGLYLISDTLIQTICTQNPSFQARISLSLLRSDIQKRLALKFSDQGLNIESYITNQELNVKFKDAINKQVSWQLEFWKNFVSNRPDMLKLMKMSFKVEKQKNIVKKIWNNLDKIRVSTSILPLVMYGMYASLANNNSIEGEKYLEQSNEDTKRLRKLLKIDELNNNTLFYDKTVQITMSGLKSKLGKILYCSSNILQVFGWSSTETKGRDINSLMTPFYAKRHDKFLNIHYKTGRVVVLNNTNLVPVRTANGFIRPSWMHVKVNPCVELGISYVAMLRPSKSDKRMVLVTKDGKIDGMSREFAKDMRLNGGDYTHDIFMLCPEFKNVNKAFNSIAESMIVPCDNSDTSMEAKNQELLHTNTSGLFDKSGLMGDSSRITTERPLIKQQDCGRQETPKKSSPDTVTVPNHFLKSSSSRNLKPSTSLDMKADTTAEISPKSDNSVQGIYERFSMNGSKLMFYPKKVYESRGSTNSSRISLFKQSDIAEPIVYNVQIMNRVYDKDVIKVLLLERITEGNHETDAEMRSSNRNFTSTTNRVTVEYAEEESMVKKLNLKRKSRVSFQEDEMISPEFRVAAPSFPPRQNHLKDQSSLAIFDITSREKRRSNEGISLSILDEIHSDDIDAKIAVPRRIIGERGGVSPRRSLKVQDNSRLSHLTDEMELSFNQNGAGGDSPRISFAGNGGAIWTLNSEPRKSAVEFSEQQFLKILDEKRGSIPKESKEGQTLDVARAAPAMNCNRSTLYYLPDQLPKEGKLLKTKLRKLKERLHEAVTHAPKAEMSVASTYLSKGKKVQSMVLQALKLSGRKKSAIIYSYFFMMFVGVMIILLALQGVHVYRGIWKAQDQIPVIEIASDVQNNVMFSYALVRLWKSRLTDDYSLMGWVYDNEIWRTYLRQIIGQFRGRNNHLWKMMNTMPSRVQEKFYEKNVRIYGEDKQLLSVSSSFEAVREIIENQIRCVNIKLPYNYSADIDTRSFDFVLDNSMNDILISSEKLISDLSTELKESGRESKTAIGATLAVILLVAFAFFVVTVRYLFRMRAEARIFMTLVFRINIKECVTTKLILEKFKSALQTNLKDFELPNEDENNGKEASLKEFSKVKFRKASLNGLYRKQRNEFLKLVPNYLLFLCWSVLYFFLALDFIENMQFSEIQMQTALEASRNRTLFSMELITLPLINPSMTVKNIPFLTDLKQNLRHVQDSGTLIDKFRDKNGDLSPLQEKLLFGFPCEDLIEVGKYQYDLYYESCVAATNGQESLGLLSLNAQLHDLGNDMLDSFESLNATKESLARLFQFTFTKNFAMMNITQGYLDILYDSTYQIFTERVDNIEKKTVIIFLVVLFGVLVSTWLTTRRVLKSIFELQKIDKYILQLIPIKMIIGNKHLQQYLLKSSNGLLDRLKEYD